MNDSLDHAALVERIRADLLDGYDAEREMAIEDRSVEEALVGAEATGPPAECARTATLRRVPDDPPAAWTHVVVGAGLALVHAARSALGHVRNALRAHEPSDVHPGDDGGLRRGPAAQRAENADHCRIAQTDMDRSGSNRGATNSEKQKANPGRLA
jgi:hypothetical protein